MIFKSVVVAAIVAGVSIGSASAATTYDFTNIKNQGLFNNIGIEIGHAAFMPVSNSAEHNGEPSILFPASFAIRYHETNIGTVDLQQSGGKSLAMQKVVLQAGFTNGSSISVGFVDQNTKSIGFEGRFDLSRHMDVKNMTANTRIFQSTITNISDATAANSFDVVATGIGAMLGYSFKVLKPYVSVDVVQYRAVINKGFLGIKGNTSTGVVIGAGFKAYLAPYLVVGMEIQKMDWVTSSDLSIGIEF